MRSNLQLHTLQANLRMEKVIKSLKERYLSGESKYYIAYLFKMLICAANRTNDFLRPQEVALNTLNTPKEYILNRERNEGKLKCVTTWVADCERGREDCTACQRASPAFLPCLHERHARSEAAC
jgi:hypothetical protein